MATIVDRDGNIAFYGRLSWANFLDWLVTFCVGAIIMLTAFKLGGVRPDTQVAILPLYTILLVLHGLWLAVDRDSPKRLSHIPIWFIPALLWMLCSVLWFTPVQWLGWYEIIYTLQAFIVLWVLSNNLRTRAHLWALIFMGLLPSSFAIFNGFYQFFQDPSSLVDAMTDYPLELNAEFLGQATGAFADPNSYAAFLLILLPSLLIAAAVRRLPTILRIFCFYVAAMFFFSLFLTQTYWAAFLVVILLAIVPWFCFRRLKHRLGVSLAGVIVSVLVFACMIFFHPLFEKGLRRAATPEGEGVRILLWDEALSLIASKPITGVGAGAYGVSFQQSPRVSLSHTPATPHNDYLLVLSQLGLVGALLFALPSLIVFFKSLRIWQREPFEVRLRGVDGSIMPPQRFFLSLGLSGSIAFGLCLMLTFVFYVPALTLYGVLTFVILVKSSFNRKLKIPEHPLLRVSYFLFFVCAGCSFYVFSSYKLQSHGLELRAQQQLDHLVSKRVHVSGNADLLDDVVLFFEDALVYDDRNVDAWLGLSSAICQKYFRNPSMFDQIGGRAVYCANHALELSPSYWMAWAQLGIAHALQGKAEAAESALLTALELAPNSSNAHYYYAAFLGSDSSRRSEAFNSVRKSLEINPKNSAARRLERKLLIL